MSRYRMVVFDWDGTLVDSTAAITEAIQEAASDLGLARPSREQASHVIGLGLVDALRLATPDLTPERTPAFIDRYRHHFLARDVDVRPFPGIPELLDELASRDCRLAVATGKSRAGLDRALVQTGWQRLFETSRCADEGAPKPDRWMLDDICRECGLAPTDLVMVGDTTHDLGMARAAGADGLAVTYGAHPAQALAQYGAIALVDSVAQLRGWLNARIPEGGRR